MSRKYRFYNQRGIYFIRSTVVNWIDVFTRPEYKNIIIESLEYCQKEKGLIVYAYVIMSNEIHLLIGKEHEEISFSDILRDFKKYTARQIIKCIRTNPSDYRKDWMLELFRKAGATHSKNQQFQFWQQHNESREIFGTDKIERVLNYIHGNPVTSGLVNEPQHFVFSSARNYADMESKMKITSIIDGELI